MLNSATDSLAALLNSVVGYDFGTNQYYVVLAASLLAKHFFDLNRLVSVITVFLSIGVGVAGIICSGLIVDVLMTNSFKMEQREERIADELEAIHRRC